MGAEGGSSLCRSELVSRSVDLDLAFDLRDRGLSYGTKEPITGTISSVLIAIDNTLPM